MILSTILIVLGSRSNSTPPRVRFVGGGGGGMAMGLVSRLVAFGLIWVEFLFFYFLKPDFRIISNTWKRIRIGRQHQFSNSNCHIVLISSIITFIISFMSSTDYGSSTNRSVRKVVSITVKYYMVLLCVARVVGSKNSGSNRSNNSNCCSRLRSKYWIGIIKSLYEYTNKWKHLSLSYLSKCDCDWRFLW